MFSTSKTVSLMLRRLGGASVARSFTRPAVLEATNTNVHHCFSTNAHFAVDSPDGEVDGPADGVTEGDAEG